MGVTDRDRDREKEREGEDGWNLRIDSERSLVILEKNVSNYTSYINSK